MNIFKAMISFEDFGEINRSCFGLGLKRRVWRPQHKSSRTSMRVTSPLRCATKQFVVVSWKNADISRRHIIDELCHSYFHKFHSCSIFLGNKPLAIEVPFFTNVLVLILLLSRLKILFANKQLYFYLIVVFIFHSYSKVWLNQ